MASTLTSILFLVAIQLFNSASAAICSSDYSDYSYYGNDDCIEVSTVIWVSFAVVFGISGLVVFLCCLCGVGIGKMCCGRKKNQPMIYSTTTVPAAMGGPYPVQQYPHQQPSVHVISSTNYPHQMPQPEGQQQFSYYSNPPRSNNPYPSV